MATTAAPAPAYAGSASASGEQSGLMSWLTTVDHKRIGTLYLWTSLSFLFVGGIEAFIMRLQLMQPNGQVVSAETFNQLFTMHGTTMVFLVVMPLSAAFFNYLIPLQIGARDVAFPRLNAFSYWVYLFGGLFMTVPIFFGTAPNGGWFGYAPLTTIQFSGGLNIDFWVLGLQILGVSSLAAAFNFITTIINMRAPGMTLMRMPMFTWMSFVVQFLLILAFPAITIALVFLLFDRFFGTQFYTLAAGADLTFMVFFLDSQGRVVSRYGGRDSQDADNRQSLEGLAHVMREVLKTCSGPSPRVIPDPAGAPVLAERLGAGGRGCIHCHQVQEAINRNLARNLHLEFIDSDHAIEQREGRPVSGCTGVIGCIAGARFLFSSSRRSCWRFKRPP